jgi:hypothetical protein
MSAVEEILGLCSTCNNAPGCYYRARRGPALFCEMFDSYVPPVERGGVEPAAPGGERVAALRAAKNDGDRYAGLCMNCRHRATCRHPRPAGGVWHCEDYE